MNDTQPTTSSADRKRLLQLARDALTANLMRLPPATLPVGDPLFSRCKGGLFVSLHRTGQLRGCIGTFSTHRPMGQAIQEMATSAAHDPRFVNDPVTREEVDELQIELSLLSPLQPTDRPRELIIGVHGIAIRRGQATGCFLPQVAVQMNWNAEQFLSACCQSKADLPPDAWKQTGTQVLLFTTEVFSEERAEERKERGTGSE